MRWVNDLLRFEWGRGKEKGGGGEVVYGMYRMSECGGRISGGWYCLKLCHEHAVTCLDPVWVEDSSRFPSLCCPSSSSSFWYPTTSSPRNSYWDGSNSNSRWKHRIERRNVRRKKRRPKVLPLAKRENDAGGAVKRKKRIKRLLGLLL